MPKLPSQWASSDGFSTSTAQSGTILLESGDVLLLENGNMFALEDVTVTPKIAAAWNSPVKSASQWNSQDGFTTITDDNANVIRTLQSDDVRITQSGDIRILQDAIVTNKYPTNWRDS